MLTKNEYILVRTAGQVSTLPFLLESYTPGQVGTGRFLSISVSMYYIMTFHDMVCTPLYDVMAPTK